MKVWASKKAIRAEVADVPWNWIDKWCLAHPMDVRRMGEAENATLMLRVEAVVKSLEEGEIFAAPSSTTGRAED